MRLFKDCTIGKFTAVFALSGALFFIFPEDAPAQTEGASSSVTVITSEEIAVEKPASIIDLLKQKVGVDVSGSEISMRGVKGVVVVVDGVTQNTIPSSLKPEDVERIEILRGAASSKYGASAMGGAVVMSTKRGEKKRTVDLIQGYGSFGRRYTKAIGSGSKGDWDFRVSLEENVTRKMYEVGPEDTPFSYMVYVEDDYTERKSADTRIGKKGKNFEMDLNLNYREGQSGYGRPNYRSESKNLKIRWSSKFTPADWLELSPVASYDDMFAYEGVRDNGTGTDAAGLAPDRKMSLPSRTQAIELQALVKKGDAARATLGLRYGVEDGSAAIKDYNTGQLRFDYRYKMSQEAVFFLLEATPFEMISIDVSGRVDRYRYYDVYIDDSKNRIYGEPLVKESFNPKIGLKWSASEGFSVRGAVSTGFIPPTPYNLYFRDTSNPVNQVLNNPDLKPETSTTFDLGVDVVLPYGLNINFTPFYTLWKDKVVRVYTVNGADSVQKPMNIGESEAWGFELQVNEKFNERWSAFLNYTLNHTEITKNADASIVGNKVPDMPESKFNIGVVYQKKDDFNIKAVWRYTGSRFLDEKNTERDAKGVLWRRDAYSVADITFIKYFRPKGLYIEDLELTIAADNVFDERYGEWFFYRNPGRTIRAEVAARF